VAAIYLRDDIVRFEPCLGCGTARDHHSDPRTDRVRVDDKAGPVEYVRFVVSNAGFQIKDSVWTVEEERETLEDAQSDVSGQMRCARTLGVLQQRGNLTVRLESCTLFTRV
jgi:hypothetical protein